MTTQPYVIACRTPWFWEMWHMHEHDTSMWHLISDHKELTLERLQEINPRYVFFPHWSHIVPDEILEAFECVCFHATPVPYGRGGSPVQNMIVRGHEQTKLSALRMTSVLDAGPLYAQQDVSLLGGGDEIYLRLARHIITLITHIQANEPEPQAQAGEPTLFKRRKPAQSELPEQLSLREAFDFIRMLDAEGYPRAFVRHGNLKLELSRPALRRDHVQADVKIVATDD